MLQSTRNAIRSESWGLVLLALAVMMGAVLRFWQLGEISVWGDEWNGNLASINAPSAIDFLRRLQIHGTSEAPLHPLLQFLWSQVTSTSNIFCLRSFNVMLNLASLPFIYALGRSLGGRTAGIVAAFCACFSFEQIWHAQSIRPYALYLLLAALSLLAFFAIIQDGKSRWIWAAVGINLLGILTHWMFCALIVAESAALLFLARKRRRLILAWGVSHAIWLIPLGLYVVSHPPMNTEFEPSTISFGKVLTALVREDVVSFSPASAPHGGIPLVLHHLLCRLPETFFGLSMLTLVAVALASRLQRTAAAAANEQFRVRLFVFGVVLLLPVGLLAVVNAVSGLAVLMQRYVVYVALIQYVVIGTAVARLPRRSLRAAAALAVIMSYGYSALEFLPAVRTTNYLGALRLIRHESKPGEFVIVDSYIGARNLLFHEREGDLPVFCATNTQVVCDAALWLLCPKDRQPEGVKAVDALWHVFNIEWNTYDPADWEKSMREAGLAYTSWQFPGMENLVVYRIVYAPGSDPPPPLEARPAEADMKDSEPLGENYYTLSEMKLRLERGRFWSFQDPLDAVCMLLLPVGKCSLAQKVAERRTAERPEPVGAYVHSLVQAFRDRSPESRRALRAAYSDKSPLLRPFREFTDAFARGDFALAFREADAQDALGSPFGGPLREAVRHLWRPASITLPFGLAPVRDADYDLIAAHFQDAASPRLTGFAPADRVLAEMSELMGRPERAKEYLREALRLQPDNAFLRECLKACEAQSSEQANGSVPGTS